MVLNNDNSVLINGKRIRKIKLPANITDNFLKGMSPCYSGLQAFLKISDGKNKIPTCPENFLKFELEHAQWFMWKFLCKKVAIYKHFLGDYRKIQNTYPINDYQRALKKIAILDLLHKICYY